MQILETPHELGAVVSRSLTQLIKRQPRTGWVKANSLTSEQTAQDILELTKKIRHLEEENKRLKSSSFDANEKLAQGSEKIIIIANITLHDSTKNWREPGRSEKLKNIKIALTWNQIFATLLPTVQQPATEALK